MTPVSKLMTLLILAALVVLIITHPGGFATDATAGGAVLNNTLSLEAGIGSPTTIMTHGRTVRGAGFNL
ncbi:MAG: hypothetical protein ACREHG_04260 [Candidatus Saccharimonadales bacterium]